MRVRTAAMLRAGVALGPSRHLGAIYGFGLAAGPGILDRLAVQHVDRAAVEPCAKIVVRRDDELVMAVAVQVLDIEVDEWWCQLADRPADDLDDLGMIGAQPGALRDEASGADEDGPELVHVPMS